MMIRNAKQGDLDTILQLGKQFGHQMLYQKDHDLMERYLPRIIVAEEDIPALNVLFDAGGLSEVSGPTTEVVGYYHYIVSGDPGFAEMLRVYRQMPENLIFEASGLMPGRLCVVMQGACHRDVFKLLINYLQNLYPELWSWNSITNPDNPSGKRDGYKALGFTFAGEDYRFWNCSKGNYSVYTLGRWIRENGNS